MHSRYRSTGQATKSKREDLPRTHGRTWLVEVQCASKTSSQSEPAKYTLETQTMASSSSPCYDGALSSCPHQGGAAGPEEVAPSSNTGAHPLLGLRKWPHRWWCDTRCWAWAWGSSFLSPIKQCWYRLINGGATPAAEPEEGGGRET